MFPDIRRFGATGEISVQREARERSPIVQVTSLAVVVFVSVGALRAGADEFEEAYSASSAAAGRADWSAALPLAERAYALGTEQFGTPHATTATLALNLGVILSKVNRREEARQRFEEAIEATEGIELAEPTDAMAWLEIARLERNEPRPDRYANRAIEILADRYDKKHPLYIRAKITRAQLMRDRGARAMESAMREAVAEAQELFGSSDPVMADALFSYAKLQLERENFEKAIRFYRRALRVHEAQEPKQELTILALHEHLAVAYEKIGDSEQVDYHMEACAIEQIGDSEPVPVIRYVPVYPRQAVVRRRSGWVDVEFTIAPNGRVQDPRVVASKPKGLFDESALEAIKTWRYKPRIQDGKVVPREGARVRIRYEQS